MYIAVGLLPLPVISKSARVRPQPFSTARQVGLVDKLCVMIVLLFTTTNCSATQIKETMLSGMGLA